MVEARNAQTLLPIIEKVCRPGTIIHSDEWAAYRAVKKITGFEHRTVNHSINFVDKITGVHTQNVESLWCQSKQIIKQMKGIRSEQLPSLLNEYIWRSNYRENLKSSLFYLLSVK